VVQAPPANGPSTVQVVQTAPGQWQYIVNGEPSVIRGVGYNPQYANLPQADRQQLYERDFGAMRYFGINTIEGWFETQFDDVTLDAAAQDGIGVIMPFELNQDWPYENPNVQQSILDHVSAYVEKYRDNPAVRMWAPGNENLHRVLYPHWVSKENDPVARARADAFAAFLPVLVDRIHQLDPNHPVLYRDAEDVYLPRLKAAFQATGVQRPWLIYGANVYSPDRLQQIISQWPSQWLDGPLVISEFAPGGAGRADRPLGFQEDWAIIRSRPDVVLGGLAYTWATNGPEELDRVFGLVDANGAPTDRALAALSAVYLQDN
jgi:beta-galactosidase/beta-glucuronidase